MRRISSLPTAEHCAGVDTIGQQVESTQALRGTVFHAYCATGVWPDELYQLPQADIEQIQGWHVPTPFNYKMGDVTTLLQYQTAMKEVRVALDHDFNYVDVPPDVPQNEIAERYPNVMVCGHLDLAWHIPHADLLIVCDIKSTIWTVKDRNNSLQLHGYGLALAAKMNVGRYVTCIWDATDGEYYVADEAIEVDGFEAADIRDRIRRASSDRGRQLTTGSYCSQCWKRKSCPAHLVDVPESEFSAVLSGNATQEQVRNALMRKVQMKDVIEKVEEACRTWVKQNGPLVSEDGTKEWRIALRQGRMGLDKKAVAQELGLSDLSKFNRRGKPYEALDWRKREGD